MSDGARLRHADLTSTYPPALQYDSKMVAFAKALAVGLQENAVLAEQVGFYYRIDELEETALDILAGDLHVDWYDATADIETKRAVIKSSIYVHRHMGTPAAVQRVLEDSFGGGSVQEWFDYDGEAQHFRVSTENIQAVNSNLEKFLAMLEKAKKAAAVLDEIAIERTLTMTMGMSIAIRSDYEYTMRTDEAEVPDVNFLTDEEENVLTDEDGWILME